DDVELSALGATLGSDVPFCLDGGAAWMRGRGERIEHVALPIGMGFLVALPPFRIATPSVYRAWDDLGRPRSKRAVSAPGPAVDERNLGAYARRVSKRLRVPVTPASTVSRGVRLG